MSDEIIANQAIYCANHPTIETSLRCRRCDKPICAKCAVPTPTGYICRECERSQQKIFDTALPRDYIFTILLSIVIGGIGSFIASYLGFFVVLLAPFVGVITAQIIQSVTQRRRSNRLFLFVAIGIILGSIPMLSLNLISLLLGGGFWGMLLQCFYVFASATTAYQRLRGINLN